MEVRPVQLTVRVALRDLSHSSCHSPSPVRRLDPELPAQPWEEAGLERKSWASKLSSSSATAASH